MRGYIARNLAMRRVKTNIMNYGALFANAPLLTGS